MKLNAYQVTYKRDGKLHREFFNTLPSAEVRAASHRANRRVAVTDPTKVSLTVTQR